VVWGEGELLGETVFTQAGLFAVEVALFRLVESFGVRPDFLLGHSIGELAAAHVAGVWSLADAAAVVAARGRLMQALSTGGVMVAVQAAEVEVAEVLGNGAEIAAVNGPSSVVISGEGTAVLAAADALKELGRKTKRLSVSHAFHSARMEPMLAEFRAVLEGVSYAEPRLPVVSNVSGRVASAGELTDPEYWVRQVRKAVRFGDGVAELRAAGVRTFLELGPDSVLTAMVRENAASVASASVLRSGRPEGEVLLSALALAHVRGCVVDWSGASLPAARADLDLPTYAFQRSRYWLDGALGAPADAAGLGLVAAGHPLVGATVRVAGTGAVMLTGRISLQAQPWLRDHAVAGVVLLPAAAFVELALQAGDRVGLPHVTELTLETPLVIPAQGALALQVHVDPRTADGRRPVGVYSRSETAGEDGEWICHAVGSLGETAESGSDSVFDLSAWPPAGSHPVDTDDFYARAATAGYGYGPAFQGLRALYQGQEGELFAEVAQPAEPAVGADRFGIHPALLDSALHALVAVAPDDDRVRLPFAWHGLTLHATGADTLRVRLAPVDGDADSILVQVADGTGRPVLSAATLDVRTADPTRLTGVPSATDALYPVVWTPIGTAPAERTDDDPELTFHHCVPTGGADADLAGAAKAATLEALTALQAWLAGTASASACFVVVTRGAVAAAPGDPLAGLSQAPVWGLVRAAQSEHPGRFLLIDIDAETTTEDLTGVARAALASGETQVAVRAGTVLTPRLTRPGRNGTLTPPASDTWRLGVSDEGTIEGLTLTETSAQPLGPGQVRVEVRAAGLNFRDVLIALGMYPGAATMGGEGAGVVTEAGPGVSGFAVGDRVFGMLPSFGPVAVADVRTVAPLPEGWSFEQGASVPVVFLTAWYGLVELGGLRPGERVLVHAGAGGVGMAAIQIARHLGAEVFATASEGKWDTLRAMGLDDSHIASSRTLDFEQKFAGGVDVVLNSLAGEFIDASVRLLRDGGRFLEMGKTDIRDGIEGVAYQAYDLLAAGPDRIGALLREVMPLFASGVLQPLAVRSFDVRRAPEAFRFMSQARHTGKLVLRMPRRLDPDGTVLITGGTGTLGRLVARHLVAEHGVRNLVLVSRSGGEVPEGLDARVVVEACDVSDREALAAVLERIPTPLTGVVHAAGVLDDGLIESLTPERLENVLRVKVDGAVNLHELTAGHDLAAFVVFSSIAGLLGNAGQANYAAANTFLDALAAQRQEAGLSGTSVAWGLWEPSSGMTGGLGRQDLARMRRSGIVAMSAEEGLALLDAALHAGDAHLAAARFDHAELRAGAQSAQGPVPGVLRGLVRAPVRRAAQAAAAASGGQNTLVERLAGLPSAEQDQALVDMVRTQAALVLGHTSAELIGPEQTFKAAGFDSLAAVELRNRLNATTDLQLSGALTFDHPTPTALAQYLKSRLLGDAPPPPTAPVAAVETDEPIAIVGMACRFPGGVESPEDLWRLVAEERDAITDFPTDRGWDLDGIYDPDPESLGKTYVRNGGFLDSVADFDAEFFGISPREALAMDPQQRLLMETSWEAFERAGIDPAALKASATGVFIGAVSQDYGPLLSRTSDAVEGYRLTGTTGSVASGRLAYTYGFEGPAVTVDTACSSSLVALHLAAQALRRGECTMALAGGATIMSSPEMFIEFSRQRGLSDDGRCKAFADSADGTAWAEGVGVLVVERLSDAVRKGHRVLAVVRGSAVNQDGASNGLTAPNGPSQQRVIRQALANAGLGTGDVDAVEAHGTGTTLGDPIEAQALIDAYGQGRTAERPLYLGSLKSNIGHAQAASGVGGVIKTVMALRAGVLPRTLHVDAPSSHVDWSAGAVELLTEAREWPDSGRPRRAGVSSFGISGTNAHVIVEEAPEAVDAVEVPAVGGVLPFVVSGRSVEGLRAQAERLAAYVRGGVELSGVASALVAGRSALEFRGVVVAADRGELVAGLEELAARESVPGGARSASRPVFVFPGQGSQWVGMAAGLLDESAVFAERIAACETALAPYVDWELREVLRSSEEDWMGRVDVVQPVLWAVMVSLAGLWESFGVRPAAVVGHSQGEIAAACVAGALSLDDAAKVVALRSQAIVELAGTGGMASLGVSAERAAELIAPYEGRVSVAAVNGPGSVTVAGEPDALDALLADCDAAGVWARRVPVDYASHSAQVESIRDRILADLADLEPMAPTVPFYSAVTAERLETAALDAAYWYTNLRQTVRFEETVRLLLADGFDAFIETSAHPVLTTPVEGTVEDAAVVLGTLRRHEGDLRRFTTALGEAYVHGLPVDWTPLVGTARTTGPDLPTYPFQRRHYWPTTASTSTGDLTSAGLARADHPLLGASVPLADAEGLLLTGALSLAAHPWLAGHRVGGTVVLPGAAVVDLAIHAADEVGCDLLEELVTEVPLVIPERGSVQVQVRVERLEQDGAYGLSIHSRRADADTDDPWTRNATAVLAVRQGSDDESGRFEVWPPTGARPIDLDAFYDRLAEVGHGYEGLFRGLVAAWRVGEDVYADVTLPSGEEAPQGFGIHPALLDAALHGVALDNTTDGQLLVPGRWADVSLSATGATAVRVRLARLGADEVAVELGDQTGRPVMNVGSLLLQRVSIEQFQETRTGGGMYRVDRAPVGSVEGEFSGQVVVLDGDAPDLGAVEGAPEVVVLPCFDGSDVHGMAAGVLGVVRAWLADARFEASRLVVVTRGPG
ncbi:SDR family NAD(P)-dependent oxidoreductase, partial [Streptomyces fumanus]|uniref:SDR family NAD(P)-dependent oxidoreductase n=1 Tax=Streptomyces fumanus TaxID=67302 RepID=UPI0033FCC303